MVNKSTKVKSTKDNLGKAQHKVIENKEIEEGLKDSLLVMLFVTLLGKSFMALCTIMDSSVMIGEDLYKRVFRYLF